MVHHFLPVGRFIPEDFFTLGLLAVRLFFVLSGYLITGILLRSRKLGFGRALKQFYIRRVLRIFPIYYLTLIVLLFVGLPSVRRFIVWHLMYLSNILFLVKTADFGPTGHFWTLSVEEQFYLVWPFLILLIPYKHIGKVIVGAIVFGLCWKTYIAFTLGGSWAGAILTPACLDSLGMGALLALIEIDERLKIHREIFLRYALLGGWAIIFLQLTFYLIGHGMRFFWSTSYLGVSLVFGWLVARASEGFKGTMGILLELKPLVYVGRISYGMYLYHNFMPGLVRYLARTLGLRPPRTLMTFFIASALTLLVAAASWQLVEKPISRWKDRFRYSTARAASVR